MARRLPKIVALAALLLLALPTAASAAYSARVVEPGNSIVTGKTDVHVRVSRAFGDLAITRLRVRVAGGEWQPTTCVADCDRGRNPVFKFELNPRTGAPFGSGIMRNGDFVFEGRISRELNARDENVGNLTVNLHVPGSAVGGLAASAEGDQVRLAWTRAPEPDITGYRIERCAGSCDGSGSWNGQGTEPASATSFTDKPGVGKHSYRVVTVRSGGGDGTIETFSSPVTTEIAPPPPPPPATPDGQTPGSGTGGDGSGDGSGDGDGGDGSPRPGGGTSNGDRSPRDGDAPNLGDGRTPEPDSSPTAAPRSSTSRSSGIRSGRAPSVSLGRGGSGIPELPGIGDIFRGELDYSPEDPEAAPGDGNGGGGGGGEGDEVVLGAPGGGSGSFIGQLTDPNRVAVPIAGGLLMTAIGLHLWRWLRIPLA